MSAPTPIDVYLLKFGTYENLLKLQAGQVHMRTVGYFRQQEEIDGRGDSYEGLALNLQPDRGDFTIDDRTGAGEIVGPIRAYNVAYDDLHVFCVTAISNDYIWQQSNSGAPLISERLAAFGSHVLFIKHDVFVARMREAAQAGDYKMDAGPVVYYDSMSYHGPVGPIHKRSAYRWQMEWRFVVEPSGKGIKNIELGSLADIAILYETKTVAERVVQAST